MSDLIPPLRDLFFTRSGFDVAEGFALRFLKLHNSNWRVAEHHWEVAVSRVLNSREVRRNAKPGKAMRIAVAATSTYLSAPLMRDRCPICGGGR
jgi:hypothetical protein